MRPLDAVVKFFGGRSDADQVSCDASAKVRKDQLEIESAICEFREVQKAITKKPRRTNGRD